MTGRIGLRGLAVVFAVTIAITWAFTHHDNRDFTRVHAVSTSDTQPSAPLIPPLDEDQPSAKAMTLTSTAYCLTSKMSDGEHGYEGAVAMNGVPLGTLVTVDDSPVGPGTFTVTDRHAPGSTGIDFYVNDCWLAQRWGRHTVEASILGHRADEYRP